MSRPVNRRGPRAALLVLITAAIAGVTVALLGFRTSQPPPPPGIPKTADLLTVTGTTTSQPVAPGFVGLSIELPTLVDHAGGDPAHPNPVFAHLLEQLAPGGRPVLRIGGNSSDRSWFSTPRVRPGRGVAYTIPPYWVPLARTLAADSGVRYILGLDLEANDPQLFAAEVRWMSGIGAPNIGAFEIGNEPEVYGTNTWYAAHGHSFPGRPRDYGYAQFSHDFTRYARLVPSRYALAGPAVGDLHYMRHAGQFLAAHQRVKIATFHLYPLHNCLLHQSGPAAPTIAHLLSAHASTDAVTQLAPTVKAVHAHHAQFRLDELNSVSCGGASGVSDRFASALWALDTLFALVRAGVDGVNLHTFAKGYYRTFRFTRDRATGAYTGEVSPVFYGLLAFLRAAPAGSRLLETGPLSSPDLRLWATQGPAPTKAVHVMLVNDSPTRVHTIAIHLPANPSHARLTLERLTAKGGLSDATGVSLAGQSFGARTFTGRLGGRVRYAVPRQTQPNIYVLKLPPASAAILTR